MAAAVKANPAGRATASTAVDRQRCASHDFDTPSRTITRARSCGPSTGPARSDTQECRSTARLLIPLRGLRIHQHRAIYSIV